MKPIKVFRLAALAAVMILAFVDASSAMAEGVTALCAEDEATCAKGNLLTHVHEESVGKAVLLSSIEVKCNVLFLGDSLEEGLGKPLRITGKFTYSECGNCEVHEENGPSEIKVLKEGHETASVTGKGLVKVVCSGFINCAYNGEGLKATAKGLLLATQENGEVSLQGQTANKEKGGFLCPATSKLDIVMTPLEPTYLSS